MSPLAIFLGPMADNGLMLDLFSRRVVGWSMKAEQDASLVMDALMMAVRRRGKADAPARIIRTVRRWLSVLGRFDPNTDRPR